MKKTVCILTALVLALLPLAGCAPAEPEPPNSLAWEVPQLNYGVLEYEKLEVLPWYSGRTEATSFNTMAESKNGYYAVWGSKYLRYAEKTDMTNWVRVCNNPSCQHRNVRCGSWVDQTTFLIYDEKIYTAVYPSSISTYVPSDSMPYIYKSNLDGSDRVPVMEAPRPDTSATTRSFAFNLTKDGILFNHTVMNTDGTFTHYWHLTNENGTHLARRIDMGEEWNQDVGMFYYGSIYGDTVIKEGYDMLRPLLGLYRIAGDGVEKLEIGHLPYVGMYVSGNTARFFRPNDGYYDYDLTTGQEVKVADAQLADSSATIVLPNCILETTMLNTIDHDMLFAEDVEQGPPHRLVLFDGESWREVELPENLRTANQAQFMKVDAVTSDMILLHSVNIPENYKTYITSYYIIDLNEKDLKVEFFMDRNDREL